MDIECYIYTMAIQSTKQQNTSYMVRSIKLRIKDETFIKLSGEFKINMLRWIRAFARTEYIRHPERMIRKTFLSESTMKG